MKKLIFLIPFGFILISPWIIWVSAHNIMLAAPDVSLADARGIALALSLGVVSVFGIWLGTR